MLKNTFLALLSFSLFAAASNAAADPLGLFVHQCLNYHTDKNQLDNSQSIALPARLVAFEKSIIAISNISDLLNYYRPFANNPEHRQQLLRCQLHLTDQLNELTTHTSTIDLLSRLKSTHEYPRYFTKTKQFLNNNWAKDKKSQLHTAQATIRHNLANQTAELSIDNETCSEEHTNKALISETHHNDRSDTEENEIKSSDIKNTIAKYLIHHKNENCRQKVWSAYQVRAKQKSHQALASIQNLRQQFANEHGFIDYATMQLSYHQLTPQLLKQFLHSSTENINITPWSIAQEIALTTHYSSQKSKSLMPFLNHIFDVLQPLGLKADFIDSQDTDSLNSYHVIRIWYEGRLLGDIFVDNTASKVSGSLMRQTVIGHQYGQYAISSPQTLNTAQQQRQLTEALSQAIVSLSAASSFYFINKPDQHSAEQQVASRWLTHYLSIELTLAPKTEREILIERYTKQLTVFRAKTALAFYQTNNDLDATSEAFDRIGETPPDNYTELFKQSFGQNWEQANDVIYSYPSIAEQGINDFLPLWYQYLTQLIISNEDIVQSSKNLFSILVINENQQTIYQQLELLLQYPISAELLILHHLQ